MRGYFTRDFYAKTAALLGLGALAAAGAIVDSWPGAVDLPAAGRAAQLAAPAVPAPRPVLETFAAAQVRPRREHRVPARVSPVDVAVDVDIDAGVARHTVVVTRTAPLPVGAPVALNAAPPPRIDAPIVVSAVTLGQPAAVDLMLAPDEPPAATRAVADAAQPGFIASALKKTGASLATLGSLGAKTGVKTGASIAGAARAVGSAVRRALPL